MLATTITLSDFPKMVLPLHSGRLDPAKKKDPPPHLLALGLQGKCWGTLHSCSAHLTWLPEAKLRLRTQGSWERKGQSVK